MSINNHKETLENGVVVFTLFPMREIDAFNGEALRSEITATLDEVNVYLLNFSEVVYLNSSGLRELIQILKSVKEAKKLMYLTSVSKDILKIFKNTNLDKLFKITTDDKEAKEIISQDS